MVRLILLEAVRVRLFWVAAAGMLLVLGLERFLGQVALIEAGGVEAAVAAALVRFAAAFMVVVFVATSMVRESADKVTELLLAQPMSRAAYYRAKLAGYVLVAVLAGLLLSLPLALAAPGAGLAYWTLSLMMELAIVAAASLFCVLSLNQVMPAVAAAGGFYLLARSMGTLQLLADAALAGQPSPGDKALDGVVHVIALLLPGLDRMTESAWFTAPPSAQQFALLVVQTAVYLVLLAAASLFDLYRRNS